MYHHAGFGHEQNGLFTKADLKFRIFPYICKNTDKGIDEIEDA